METIVVTDDVDHFTFLSSIVPVIPATEYLAQTNVYHHVNNLRVINLCGNYGHQTIGYYVSLLAQARGHKAVPSADNIQDVLHKELSQHLSQDLHEDIEHSLKNIQGDHFTLSVYFGQNIAQRHAKLAHKLYSVFPMPMVCFQFHKKKKWAIQDLKVLTIEEVPPHHISCMQKAAIAYLSKKRVHLWRKKTRFHDLAILIDPKENTPPSNIQALHAFAQAGEAIGLNVDFIEKNDGKMIAEYDALFIRATTAVNHYTYRMAKRAEQENLIVIDSPQSIVKCTNKVYLAELMHHHHIPTPHTVFISKYDKVLPQLNFPCVLKRPDGACSQGVLKIDDIDTLHKTLQQFFKSSDLVLVQPFIPTDFDWRIGVLDNKPIFASQYFMANGHWQIFNWQASPEDTEGGFSTLPIKAVPPDVIKTALKATRLIGNDLYGVDIKTYENKHYVIEINDNPSIDFGIEDVEAGSALYHTIMDTFLQRIRRKHGYL